MRAVQFVVLGTILPAALLKNDWQNKIVPTTGSRQTPVASTLVTKQVHRILFVGEHPGLIANGHLQSSSSSKIRLGAIYQRSKEMALSSFVSIIDTINEEGTLLPQNVTLEPVYEAVNNTPYETLDSLCHTFAKKGVKMLLFVCSEPCSKMSSLAGQLGLTGVIIDRKSHPEDYSASDRVPKVTFLDIVPPDKLQNQALILLLSKFNWSELCLVYDDSRYTYSLVQDLYHRKKYFKIISSIKYTGLNNSFNTELSEMKTKVRVFVLYCSYSNGLTILDHAKILGLTNKDFVWIVGETLVKRSEPVPASFPVGLLGIEYHSNDVTSLVHDAVETMARAIAANINRRGLNVFSWSQRNCDKAYSNITDELELFKEMTRVTFHGRTGIVSFDATGQRTRARYKYLNLRTNTVSGHREWQEVGRVEDDRVEMQQIVWPGDVLHTPSGQTRVRLKMVTYQVKPLVQVNDYDKDSCYSGMKCQMVFGSSSGERLESKCCYGVCIDILMKLSDDLGFTPDIYVMDLKAGSKGQDGRWTGLIGEVMYNKADFAMASITITEKRSEVIDFSVPYYHTGLRILVAKSRGSLVGNGFLRPFQPYVWGILFGLLYFSATVLYFLESLNPGLKRLLRNNKKHTKFDIHVSIWVLFSRFFNSNLEPHHPNFYSSRVLVASWGFACLVIGALYTANLAAFMVLTEPENMLIDGINDSKIQDPGSSKLRLATIRNTSVERYFSRNFPHVHQLMNQYSIYNSSKAAVQAVKNREIDAFVWEEIFLKNYEAHDAECSILTVGKSFDMSGFGLVFSKGSKWTKKVNEALLKYEQHGFISEKADRWSRGSCSAFKKQGPQLSTDPIAVESVLGVFYMLLAGISYSALVLVVEHIVFRFRVLPNRRRSQKEGDEPTVRDTELCNDTNTVKEPDNLLLVKVEKELINLAMDLSDLRKENFPERVHDLSTKLKSLQESREKRITNQQETAQNTEPVSALTLGEMRQLIDRTRWPRVKHQRQYSNSSFVERESVL